MYTNKFNNIGVKLLIVAWVIILITVLTVVLWIFAGDKDSPIVACNKSYIVSVKSIEMENEASKKSCIKQWFDIDWLQKCLSDVKKQIPNNTCDKDVNSFTSSWTASGAIVPPPPSSTDYEKLELLYRKVCDKQINSPLCKDKELYYRLYKITEERIPWKNFFPILIWITNAESSLWLDFAKDNLWWTCQWRNNWWWTKYQINDDNTRNFSRKLNWFDYWASYTSRFVDQYWCNLYPFNSVEEFWITKVNWMRYWYPWCIISNTPVRCLSYQYVWDPNVAEQSWINNVSEFIIYDK